MIVMSVNNKIVGTKTRPINTKILWYVIYIFWNIDTLLYFSTFCFVIKFNFVYADYVEGKRPFFVDLQKNHLWQCIQFDHDKPVSIFTSLAMIISKQRCQLCFCMALSQSFHGICRICIGIKNAKRIISNCVSQNYWNPSILSSSKLF